MLVDAIAFLYSLFTSPSFAEITAFSDRHAEFEQLNTEILGISVDSVVSCFLHLSWTLLKPVAGKPFFSRLINWCISFNFQFSNKYHMELSARSAHLVCVLQYRVYIVTLNSYIVLSFKTFGTADCCHFFGLLSGWSVAIYIFLLEVWFTAMP